MMHNAAPTSSGRAQRFSREIERPPQFVNVTTMSIMAQVSIPLDSGQLKINTDAIISQKATAQTIANPSAND
jgi:hypothetical protein